MARKRSGVWDRIGAMRFAPGKGVTEPPPERGWKRVFFLLGTHGSKMIALNLLFLAFSVLVLTIPAALCGMNRALMKLYREGNCFVWTEFWKEFRANIWKALPFGLLGGLCLFASYYFLSLGVSLSSGGVALLPAALGIFLLAFTVLLLNYVFLFLPTLDLNNGQIARNAFIFLLTEWKANAVILASVGMTALFSALLFPYTLPLLFFVSVSCMQLVVCAAVNGPLQKRIIGPYEERARHNESKDQG